MPKLVLTPITDNDHATTMNANLTAIEAAIENTLSRDGTSPNSMNADLNLNSYYILNMPAGTAPTHPLQKQQIEDLITGITGGGLVTSVFGRTLDVVGEVGDYSAFYAPLSHTHVLADIIDFDTNVDDGTVTGQMLSWNDVTSNYEPQSAMQLSGTELTLTGRDISSDGDIDLTAGQYLINSDIVVGHSVINGGGASLFSGGIAIANATAALTGGLEVANSLTGSGFERVLTESDGAPYSTELRILTDITTATPPANESPLGQLTYYDADESDQLGFVGFNGAGSFVIANYMRGGGSGGTFRIELDDAGGVASRVFDAQGDGNTRIAAQDSIFIGDTDTANDYAQFSLSGSWLGRNGTAKIGVSNAFLGGSLTHVNVYSDANNDTTNNFLYFTWLNNTARGLIGMNNVNHLQMKNEVHGGAIQITGENASGATRNLFIGYPNTECQIYHPVSNEIILRSVASASGGLEVLNNDTGGGYERVLTTGDLGGTGSAITEGQTTVNPTGNWTFDTDTIGDVIFQRQSTTAATGIGFSNTDGIKGYMGFDDAETFTVYDNVVGTLATIDNAGNANFTGDTTVDGYFNTNTATDAELNAIANAINTSAGKIQGAMVYNTTQDTPVWAVGSADGSVWVDGAGTTVNTPV